MQHFQPDAVISIICIFVLIMSNLDIRIRRPASSASHWTQLSVL